MLGPRRLLAIAMALNFVVPLPTLAVPLVEGIERASPQAERQDVTAAEIDAALARHAATAQSDREAVLRVLQRREVQRIAEAMGLDLTRVEDAAATLDGEELERIAERAREVERGLAGGDTITFTTTTLIIILLFVILIIVAVD